MVKEIFQFSFFQCYLKLKVGFLGLLRTLYEFNQNLEGNMAGETCRHNSLSCMLQIVNALCERRFSSEGVGSLEDHEHELELSDRS